jgi:hypothetical protein
MLRFLEDYAKHAALNYGQALQGLRYLLSHPDIDARARRGTLKHAALSLGLRSRRVANDLLFAALPPQWHHSREELLAMRTVSLAKWFQYGYCAWRFEEDGSPKADISAVDRRWDPRCGDPPIP